MTRMKQIHSHTNNLGKSVPMINVPEISQTLRNNLYGKKKQNNT